MSYETSTMESDRSVYPPAYTASSLTDMDATSPVAGIREQEAQVPGYSSRPAAGANSNIGVYVRQPANTQRELDVLWANSRHFHKEDRSPIVFTAAGLLLGILIASAIFFLLSQKPQIATTGTEPGTVTAVQEADILAEENNLPDELTVSMEEGNGRQCRATSPAA
ncbi:MAG: hypothetical protein U0003_01375 [Vampirovibrionales bacterium]